MSETRILDINDARLLNDWLFSFLSGPAGALGEAVKEAIYHGMPDWEDVPQCAVRVDPVAKMVFINSA